MLTIFSWQDASRLAAGITFFGLIFLLFTYCFDESDSISDSKGEYEDKKAKYNARAPPIVKKKYIDDVNDDDDVHHHLKHQNLTNLMTIIKRYASWWCHRQFIFIAVVNSTLSILATFEGFISLWLINIIPNLSPAVAGSMGATLPAGIYIY